MGLFDFMKGRGGKSDPPQDPDFDPKIHGHKTWGGVYAEIRADEASAKLRNETGREPECTPLKEAAPPSRPAGTKQPGRVRIKSHDIPF